MNATRRWKIDDLLAIVCKIDHGIRDAETIERIFDPLWRHPFLRECFIAVLEAPDDEIYRANFENICQLICPEFTEILATIEE